MDTLSWKKFFEVLSFVVVFAVPVILYLMEKAGTSLIWIFVVGWLSIAAAALYLVLSIPWVWADAPIGVRMWRISLVSSIALLAVGYGATKIWPNATTNATEAGKGANTPPSDFNKASTTEPPRPESKPSPSQADTNTLRLHKQSVRDLIREYVLSHDGLTPAEVAGTEITQREAEWINGRLKEKGETWKVAPTIKSSTPDAVGLTPGRPSGGPGIRVEGHVPIPSWQQCQGLGDKEELKCLCPRPLYYTLKRLPSPKDNNYSTEVTITAVREPMFRIRIYSRTPISRSVLTEVFPNDKNSVTGQYLMDYDRNSVVIQSSAPQTKFTLVMDTSEALRLKCVNQEN